MKILVLVMVMVMVLCNFVAIAQYSTPPNVVAEVDKIVAKCPHPFKQWSDGQVGSLARSLYIKLKVIPAARTNGIKWSVFESYKVLAATEEGCRIQPTDSKGRKFKEVYIKDLKGITDKTYGLIYVRLTGDYSYKLLMEDARTIPEYEYGRPITQEEFTRKFQEQNS